MTGNSTALSKQSTHKTKPKRPKDSQTGGEDLEQRKPTRKWERGREICRKINSGCGKPEREGSCGRGRRTKGEDAASPSLRKGQRHMRLLGS